MSKGYNDNDEDGEAQYLRAHAERLNKIHDARRKHYSERSSAEEKMIHEWEDEDND